MTISKTHEKMIEDTLNYNRLSHSGCFVSNEAAEELKKCDISALPEIEDAIRSRVVPGAFGIADHNDLLHRYPGLLSLWVAYFQLGKGGDVGRIADFLRCLDGAVLASAVLAMRSVWYKKGTSKSLPTQLLELVRDVAERRAGNAAEVAKHQLDSVWERKVLPQSG